MQHATGRRGGATLGRGSRESRKKATTMTSERRGGLVVRLAARLHSGYGGFGNICVWCLGRFVPWCPNVVRGMDDGSSLGRRGNGEQPGAVLLGCAVEGIASPSAGQPSSKPPAKHWPSTAQRTSYSTFCWEPGWKQTSDPSARVCRARHADPHIQRASGEQHGHARPPLSGQVLR